MKTNINDLISALRANGANVSVATINTGMADRHAASIVDLMEKCLEEAKGKFAGVDMSDVLKLVNDEIERRKINQSDKANMVSEMQKQLDEMCAQIKAKGEELELKTAEREALKDEVDRLAEKMFNGSFDERTEVTEKTLQEVIDTQPRREAIQEEIEQDDETRFLESEEYEILATLEILGRSIYLCWSEEYGMEIHHYHDGDLHEDFQYGCKQHGTGPALDAFAGMVSTLLMEERSSQAIAQDRLHREDIAVNSSDMREITESVLTKLFGVDMSSATPMKDFGPVTPMKEAS